MSSIPQTKPVILYLDYDIHNLIFFIALFGENYKIISVSSEKEARFILEKELVEIIICSKYLGPMDGVDFLASTIDQKENCMRLLVSGYEDQDAGEKAQAYDYLINPWDKIQVGKILAEAHELFVLKDIITKNFW